jgi:hypothetical protein
MGVIIKVRNRLIEDKTMFNVTITYKSGKVEEAQIKIREYAEVLAQLVEEGGLVSVKINSVV